MHSFSDPDWPTNEADAEALQLRLAKQVDQTALPSPPEMIAGVDVAYDEATGRVFAAISVLNAQTLDLAELRIGSGEVNFPYIPGLFSFRELPPILDVARGLTTKVDLFVCDGHGLSHPRRFGLACHLGVVLDAPVIGCAKTPLTGNFDMPGPVRGDWSPIVEDGETIGAALRTQTDVKPVFVSVGHRASIEDAIEITLKLTPRFRLPETTRQADQAVHKAMAAASKG